jgi:hypothetical protein
LRYPLVDAIFWDLKLTFHLPGKVSGSWRPFRGAAFQRSGASLDQGLKSILKSDGGLHLTGDRIEREGEVGEGLRRAAGAHFRKSG